MDLFFSYLDVLDDSLWTFLGFPVLIFIGIYFSMISKFAQLRRFPHAVNTFFSMIAPEKEKHPGVHPLKAFFACIGGCIGIGNIVAICTAVQIGGPGALLWVWMTAILGMMVKYAEVYLGLRYRVKNLRDSYDGGPMYFLQRVFKGMAIPILLTVLLCVYGVEVYQFRVMSKSIAINFGWNDWAVTLVLLALVIWAGSGGVNRVGEISGAIIPGFILIYLVMGTWVILQHASEIPAVLSLVFTTAFTGHAAVGGFVGSTFLVALTQGIRRGCYSSDIGIGYASVIHSETSVEIPERQASLTFFDIFLDSFVICTISVLIILLTGTWKEGLHESILVQTALAYHFPYMDYFMPLFLFLLGYSTIIAYFVVGLKCADFLSPKYGRPLYYIYAVAVLLLFSFRESYEALTLMSITQVTLLFINCYGMFRLRNEVSFEQQ